MKLALLFVWFVVLTQPAELAFGQVKGRSSGGEHQGSVYVQSQPSGKEIYIVPQSALGQSWDVLKLTGKQYVVGKTPLGIDLAPGEYSVTIKCEPMYFQEDGETSYIVELHEGGAYLVGKTYRVSVQEGHTVSVSALFWPIGQPLRTFIDTIPAAKRTFTFPDGPSLNEILKEHDVQESVWEPLSLMFHKTGKVVWHNSLGASGNRCLFVYLRELQPEKLLTVIARSETETPDACRPKISR